MEIFGSSTETLLEYSSNSGTRMHPCRIYLLQEVGARWGGAGRRQTMYYVMYYRSSMHMCSIHFIRSGYF